MAKTTVYSFVRHCLNDHEFNVGGIPTKEKHYLDAIGFEYRMKDGEICWVSQDVSAFYDAMYTIKELCDKYKKGD